MHKNGNGMYWDEESERWRSIPYSGPKNSRINGRHTRARILDAICRLFDENDYPPTIREICREAEVPSTSHVAFHLRILREEGYISYQDRLYRTMKVLRRNYDIDKI